MFSLVVRRCGERGIKDNVYSFVNAFSFDGFPKPNLDIIIHIQSTARNPQIGFIRGFVGRLQMAFMIIRLEDMRQLYKDICQIFCCASKVIVK